MTWHIEIVTADNVVSLKTGFPTKDTAVRWLQANVGKPEYKGALFHISQDDPTYRGPPPPATPMPTRH